jgi:ATP-dependent Clp protease protease subunit
MRANRSPFGRVASAPRAKAGELFLYDEIGFFGIQAEAFIRELQAFGSEDVTLRINSPGGSVFEGRAIATAIQQYPGKVTAYVDGLAASMASVIAVMSDEVVMADGAFMMIHDPWSIVLGSAADMRKEADLLDKVGDSLVGTYAQRSGQDADAIRELMRAETWFDADEAIEAGLADAKTEGKAAAARFDLSVFGNVPEQLKARQERPAPKELERLLRDAGFSRAEAKAFVAEGRKALTQRDVGEEAEDLAAFERWVQATQALCV